MDLRGGYSILKANTEAVPRGVGELANSDTKSVYVRQLTQPSTANGLNMGIHM